MNDTSKLVDQTAAGVAPATYPRFRQDLLAMLKEMDAVYEKEPVEAHAKGFAKALVKYGCA